MRTLKKRMMKKSKKILGIGLSAILVVSNPVAKPTILQDIAGQVKAATAEREIQTNGTREASVYHKEVNGIKASSRYNCDWTYAATTPDMVNFWDYKGCYNIVSYQNKVLYISRYDDSLECKDTIEISNPYSLFGNVTCDEQGYYYVVWGQSDTNGANSVVTCLAKYDYQGNKVGECEIKGYDSNPYAEWGLDGSCWGTAIPFDAGTCKLSINKNVISCIYARQMYNGHQSNYVFYVDCNTMKRLYEADNTPYCSHSFDQEVIAVSGEGFLYANQGDATCRGFYLSKVITDVRAFYEEKNSKVTFHFREGANRDHGYNETYAQLGGLAETDNAYVLCASSERALSVDTAPTNTNYCGHSEARDLLLQILKKDFTQYTGSDMYYVSGATRTAEGTKPTEAETELMLTGDEKDYGVIWLTKLDENHYVCNPKILPIESDKFVVLWEELSYDTQEGDSYYEVLKENGEVVIEKTKISDTYLMGNASLTYHNNCVYWATSDEHGQYIHQLDISSHNFKPSIVIPATCTEDGTKKYICTDCGEEWKEGPVIPVPAIGHKYENPIFDWSADNKTSTLSLTCANDASHVVTYSAVVDSKEKEAATCIKKGITTYIASYEDYQEVKDVQDIPIDSENHKVVVDKAVEATCTETGLTEGSHCSDCNEILAEQKIILAKGHGDTIIKNAKSATTTETGYTGDTYCSVCGEMLCTGDIIEKIPLKVQKITVSAKAAKTVSFKVSKLKKKSASFSISAKAKGTISYKVSKGSGKYISVSSKGKVMVKKGCKKGTYKITITASATNIYKKATKVITIKVK